jgi:glycosyltransferase involved in cell wall biosynthesis
MKKVSVVIPTFNEEKYIKECVDSVINNDYPNKEIIVVDGMSTDNTRNILKSYENIKILDNDKKITPIAMNIGMKNSTGDYVMIAGAHTTYSENYISECVKRLDENKCAVAGGTVVNKPGDDSLIGRTISEVLSHPFGVGGGKYRTGYSKESLVDTVAYGVYKREIFEKVGLFNENLVRNQDIDLNLRIKRAGYDIILVPKAKATYYSRTNVIKLIKNNFSNGYWVINSAKFSKIPFSVRHLVPLLFVLFIIFGGIISSFVGFLKMVYVFVIAFYFAIDLYFSTKIKFQKKKLSIFLLFITFFLLHVSYGIGSLIGILKYGVKNGR